MATNTSRLSWLDNYLLTESSRLPPNSSTHRTQDLTIPPKVAEQYDAALLKKDAEFLDKLFDERGTFVDETHRSSCFQR